LLAVIDGVVALRTDADELVLTPHDAARIPAGIPHRHWNAGDEEARIVETRLKGRDRTRSVVSVRHSRRRPRRRLRCPHSC
jgi:uncharacterized cupin superfamily protein